MRSTFGCYDLWADEFKTACKDRDDKAATYVSQLWLDTAASGVKDVCGACVAFIMKSPHPPPDGMDKDFLLGALMDLARWKAEDKVLAADKEMKLARWKDDVASCGGEEQMQEFILWSERLDEDARTAAKDEDKADTNDKEDVEDAAGDDATDTVMWGFCIL